MPTTIIHVHVKAGAEDAFIEACRLNHEASVLESGKRRFDVLQLAEGLPRFVLYEVYASAEDAAARKQTAYDQTWRDTVADMMTEPKQEVSYNGLFPAV